MASSTNLSISKYDPNVNYPIDKFPWCFEVLNEIMRLVQTKTEKTQNDAINKVINDLITKWEQHSFTLISRTTIRKKIDKMIKEHKRLVALEKNYLDRNSLLTATASEKEKHQKFITAKNKFDEENRCLFDLVQENTIENATVYAKKFYQYQSLPRRKGNIKEPDREFLEQQRKIREEQEEREASEPRRRSSQYCDQNPYIYYDDKASADMDVDCEPNSIAYYNNEENMEDAAELEEDDEEDDFVETDQEFLPPNKRKKKRISIATKEFCQLMDAATLASKPISAVVGLTLKYAGVERKGFCYSRQHFDKKRNFYGQNVEKESIASFQMERAIIHFDGKKYSDSYDRWFEHIVISASFGKDATTLGLEILKKPNGDPDVVTGDNVAQAVLRVLTKYGISEEIIAFCFDTTAVNSGYKSGAVKYLKDEFPERCILEFACRHHIHELVLNKVFTLLFGKTSGPMDTLFKPFRKSWSEIQDKEPDSTEEEDLSGLSEERKNHLIQLLKRLIKIKQIRDDYNEFCQLSLMFLTGDSSLFKFKAMARVNNSRWMGRLIGCLKMYFFRSHFDLGENLQKIKRLIRWGVFVYVEKWMTSTLSACAPNNDLKFLKECLAFSELDESVGKTAFNQIQNHLW